MITQFLETLSATSWFWIFSSSVPLSIVLHIWFCFILLWWIVPLYIFWMWYDKNTIETGGRPIEWIRQWPWWKYVKGYFNYKLVVADGTQLDAKKNYIFACFPHAIVPIGGFSACINGYHSIFPNHRVFGAVASVLMWTPLARDFFMALGAVSVSAASIRYILNKRNGGNIVSIFIGGADEMKYNKHGQYKIILKKRKGFVKLALETGSPLVPVITFGETDIFGQVDLPPVFDGLKKWFRKITRAHLTIPMGKYFIFPNNVSLTTVVGKPIDVEKIINPSNEEINRIHDKFMEEIEKLFEDQKHKYVDEPNKTFLEIS